MPATATRKRPTRTRTKRTNGRPPLHLSTLPVQSINLRTGEESLLCPTCDTWCPITGQGTPKLAPHSKNGRRCVSSNQLLAIDISIEDWANRLAEVDQDARSRRRPRQFYKPLPAPAPAPMQMAFSYTTLRNGIRAHRAACRPCRAGRPCDHGRLLQQRITRLAQAALQQQTRRTA
ncbi:hypothetical protein [Streptomyces olivaceiscleroticus]|uniref:Uncharacterized protein n=1 Tax=Streptomyces olivaceiscleroticus TaxID=68245 RepID=A0ABN0ZPM9_9ACTN